VGLGDRSRAKFGWAAAAVGRLADGADAIGASWLPGRGVSPIVEISPVGYRSAAPSAGELREAAGVLGGVSTDGRVDPGALLERGDDRVELYGGQGAGHLLGAHPGPLATERAAHAGRCDLPLLGHGHDVALRLSLDGQARQGIGEHHELAGVDP